MAITPEKARRVQASAGRALWVLLCDQTSLPLLWVRPNNGFMVHIRVQDEPTARALRTRLGLDFPVAMMNGTSHRDAGTTIVTTALDTSPAECLELTLQGYSVILLVPARREPQREEYARAGARAYLEMRPDATELVETVRALEREAARWARPKVIAS